MAKLVAYKHPVKLIEARELHKPVIQKFKKRRIITLGIDDLWAADLVVMTAYASENDGYKYMLNVIDTFSKYAWCEPLRTKSGVDVSRAFANVLNRTGRVGHRAPHLLHVDKGKEFVNKDFKRLLAIHDVQMYHTENEEKSAIVERFNRTLNCKMKVQFEFRKSFKWMDIVQRLIKEYNEVDMHRTIGMCPAEVTASNEAEILQKYDRANQQIPVKPRFAVGDRVRITTKKSTFANKYSRNWRTEIFYIIKVIKTRPVTYRIADSNNEEILGSFYERELQKTVF